MARPLRILLPSGCHHVTCRGSERKAMFKDDCDRPSFLEKLRGSLAIDQVEIHAYALMNNQFHFNQTQRHGFDPDGRTGLIFPGSQ